MEGLSTFINNASKATGIADEKCDVLIQAVVKAVNAGAIGKGNNILSQLSAMRKNKVTTTKNIVSHIMKENPDFDAEEVKAVSAWMVGSLIQTMNQGGMPAQMKIAGLIKKGKQSTEKEVSYDKEVEEINNLLKK